MSYRETTDFPSPRLLQSTSPQQDHSSDNVGIKKFDLSGLKPSTFKDSIAENAAHLSRRNGGARSTLPHPNSRVHHSPLIGSTSPAIHSAFSIPSDQLRQDAINPQPNYTARGAPAFLIPKPPTFPNAKTADEPLPSNRIHHFTPSAAENHRPIISRPASTAPAISKHEIFIPPPRSVSRNTQHPMTQFSSSSTVLSAHQQLQNVRFPSDRDHSHSYSGRHPQDFASLRSQGASQEYWPSAQPRQHAQESAQIPAAGEYADEDMDTDERIVDTQGNQLPMNRARSEPDSADVSRGLAPDLPSDLDKAHGSSRAGKRRLTDVETDYEEGFDVFAGSHGSPSAKRVRLPSVLSSSSAHDPPFQTSAKLHREFEGFYHSEDARVQQLRNKWTTCSLEEWKNDGEELNKQFGELTSLIQNYMM
ncbi:hypothetical protein DL93DRAFT_500140 [Clavulina sp. PMI_390]|nr:hypothetical protein DL93DRAFT_500140 [Clavulina sp. PMI_390]